jgi:hypothetical protein
MLAFFTDIANISFMLGVMSIYGGLSMYKWENQGWRFIAAPMAIVGVFGVSYTIAFYINAVMGLLAGGLFGGIVCFSLFMVGHENQ